MSEMNALNYQPLYGQIKALLVKRLANNEWPPGTALPSEIALAQEYNVSQGTVRKALTTMEKEHLVERRQGRGTFAARHSQQRSLFQFFHMVNDNGERALPISRVIRCYEACAHGHESEALALRRAEPVILPKIARSNGGHRSADLAQRRRESNDTALLAGIHAVIADRPTNGYRRIAAEFNRQR